jgi:hypothetical protein
MTRFTAKLTCGRGETVECDVTEKGDRLFYENDMINALQHERHGHESGNREYLATRSDNPPWVIREGIEWALRHLRWSEIEQIVEHRRRWLRGEDKSDAEFEKVVRSCIGHLPKHIDSFTQGVEMVHDALLAMDAVQTSHATVIAVARTLKTEAVLL